MEDRNLEFWVAVNGFPGVVESAALAAEAAGWDGITVPDSQNLTGDPYVALALAARATDHLLVAPGVTNPITRHPAVTATAIASLQEESGGRAVLGIGRGDSSLAYLGAAPAPTATFADYIDTVQRLLRREAVPFDAGFGRMADLAGIDTLGGSGPQTCQLRWLLHATAPKPPVEVVASGPRTIALGALLADRLTLAIGASPERIQWGIGLARDARVAAGLDPDALVVGAMVPITVSDDHDRARQAMAADLVGFLRFSVMRGQVVGPISSTARRSLEDLAQAYNMNHHARHGRQSELVTDELVDTFAVTGPAGDCATRLSSLVSSGITVFHLQGDFFSSEPSENDPWQRVSETVLPLVRQCTAAPEAGVRA